MRPEETIKLILEGNEARRAPYPIGGPEPRERPAPPPPRLGAVSTDKAPRFQQHFTNAGHSTTHVHSAQDWKRDSDNERDPARKKAYSDVSDLHSKLAEIHKNLEAQH